MLTPASMASALAGAYRRTGADLPFGDPRPTHGAEMEGWFWRFTDARAGRVVLALCGVNRHPDGDWATVAVAAHPGGLVRSAAVDAAWASPDRFEVVAGDVLRATADELHVDLGGVRLDARLRDVAGWPRRAFHGGGLFSVVPFLGQYWHPHVLGGRVEGEVDLGADGGRWDLGDATPYAEKNWGAGFPQRWWWGQAQGFERDDVCVAFGGGHLVALGGRVGIDVGGVVARVGDEVIHLAPPLALVRMSVEGGCWLVEGRGRGTRIRVVGDGRASQPHVLPVPLPAERRNVMADYEHQAAAMTVTVERGGRVLFRGRSELAALEVGSLDPSRTYEELARLRSLA